MYIHTFDYCVPVFREAAINQSTMNQVEGGASVVTWYPSLKYVDQVFISDVLVIEYPGACREGGSDVGEHWHT